MRDGTERAPPLVPEELGETSQMCLAKDLGYLLARHWQEKHRLAEATTRCTACPGLIRRPRISAFATAKRVVTCVGES